MDLTGTLQPLTFRSDGKPLITFCINEKAALLSKCPELEGCTLDIKIDKHREKRSIQANSYAWVLIGKIARELNTSDDEVYHIMLSRYGQNELNKDGAVKTISTQDELTGDYYIHSAPIGRSELNGKIFTHYRMILGSSQYDTKQMSQFIDGIVSEAKELGIETLTPNELSAMCERWKK